MIPLCGIINPDEKCRISGILQCKTSFFSHDVTSCVSKMEFLTKRSEQFVEDTFEGSLPRFLSAFSQRFASSPDVIGSFSQIKSANFISIF